MRISIYAIYQSFSERLFLTADHTKNIIDFFILIKQKNQSIDQGNIKTNPMKTIQKKKPVNSFKKWNFGIESY